MPRKRLDPSIKFADVVPIWTAVLRDAGGVVPTKDDNHTISLVYRLNQYRKAVREEDPIGWTDMDRFIVRRGFHCVEIWPRISVDYLSVMTKLDGTPSSRPESKPTELDPIAAKYANKLIDDEPLSVEEQRTMREVKEIQSKQGGG